MRDEILQGRYAIERQLRKHAGRQTLLARDLATQELVVIKLLTFSNDFEWQDLKLFAREAQILHSVWGEPVLILFPIFHWAFGIWIFLAILFTLFGKIRFCLTPEKISLTYEFLGLKYTFPRSGKRQDIDKLEVVERQVVRSGGAIKERVRVSVPSQLVIWTGKRKYVLGRNALTQWLRISRRRVLHASELDWLAQELSDWLELPISRK